MDLDYLYRIVCADVDSNDPSAERALRTMTGWGAGSWPHAPKRAQKPTNSRRQRILPPDPRLITSLYSRYSGSS